MGGRIARIEAALGAQRKTIFDAPLHDNTANSARRAPDPSRRP